eukprot:SAG31_NODE_3207_length_4553_cov_1.406376_5_plen_79_part_00
MKSELIIFLPLIISTWFEDQSDTELLQLISFLDTIARTSDVRAVLREQFRLRELVEQSVSKQGENILIRHSFCYSRVK